MFLQEWMAVFSCLKGFESLLDLFNGIRISHLGHNLLRNKTKKICSTAKRNRLCRVMERSETTGTQARGFIPLLNNGELQQRQEQLQLNSSAVCSYTDSCCTAGWNWVKILPFNSLWDTLSLAVKAEVSQRHSGFFPTEHFLLLIE